MVEKDSKNISLTPHWQRFVQDRVRSGRYRSASEVVREGLRLMAERDASLAETGRRISIGVGESRRGEGRDGEAVMAEQRRRLVRRLDGGKNAPTPPTA